LVILSAELKVTMVFSKEREDAKLILMKKKCRVSE